MRYFNISPQVKKRGLDQTCSGLNSWTILVCLSQKAQGRTILQTQPWNLTRPTCEELDVFTDEYESNENHMHKRNEEDKPESELNLVIWHPKEFNYPSDPVSGAAHRLLQSPSQCGENNGRTLSQLTPCRVPGSVGKQGEKNPFLLNYPCCPRPLSKHKGIWLH